MKIEISLTIPSEVMAILQTLLGRTETMAMKQSEAVDALKALTTKINKVGVETGNTLQKVTDLTTLVEELKAKGETVPPELEAAIGEAQTAAQTADDLTPDAATPLPEPVVEPAPGAAPVGDQPV